MTLEEIQAKIEELETAIIEVKMVLINSISQLGILGQQNLSTLTIVDTLTDKLLCISEKVYGTSSL